MIIRLDYENVETMKQQHQEMITWHATMQKEHQDAMEWHQAQVADLEKAIVKVPLDPEKVPAPSAGSPHGSTTDAQESTPTSATTVPLDPAKKSQLVEFVKSVGVTEEAADKIVDQLLQIEG